MDVTFSLVIIYAHAWVVLWKLKAAIPTPKFFLALFSKILKPIFFSLHWRSSAPALASTLIFELFKNRPVLLGGSQWDRKKLRYESF